MATRDPQDLDLRPCSRARNLPGRRVAAVLDLERRGKKRRCPLCSQWAVWLYPRGLYCHACGKGAVDLAAAVWGVRPIDAARRLLAELDDVADLLVPDARPDPEAAARRRRLAAAWSTVLRGPLGGHVDAREWLHGRGLDGAYGDDVHGMDPTRPELGRALLDAGATVADLTSTRVVSPWGAWLVAVYRDPDGMPDAVRVRPATPPPPWWTGKPPKWLNFAGEGMAPAWPWHAERARGARVVVVVEGETDGMAVQLALDGAPDVAVLAAPGASTWRPAWGDLLTEGERVVVLADKDGAGKGFAARVRASSPGNVRRFQVARDGLKDAADLWRAGRLRAALRAMEVLR